MGTDSVQDVGSDSQPNPSASPAKPRISWWVWIDDATEPLGRKRIRRTASMRGRWDCDATCVCGWDTQTGGALRSYIEKEVWLHTRIYCPLLPDADTTPQ